MTMEANLSKMLYAPLMHKSDAGSEVPKEVVVQKAMQISRCFGYELWYDINGATSAYIDRIKKVSEGLGIRVSDDGCRAVTKSQSNFDVFCERVWKIDVEQVLIPYIDDGSVVIRKNELIGVHDDLQCRPGEWVKVLVLMDDPELFGYVFRRSRPCTKQELVDRYTKEFIEWHEKELKRKNGDIR